MFVGEVLKSRRPVRRTRTQLVVRDGLIIAQRNRVSDGQRILDAAIVDDDRQRRFFVERICHGAIVPNISERHRWPFVGASHGDVRICRPWPMAQW